MLFSATWMQPEIIMLSKDSQRKTNTICYYILYEHEPICEIQTHGHRALVYGCQRGRMGEGRCERLGLSRCKLLYMERINRRFYCIVRELYSVSYDKP